MNVQTLKSLMKIKGVTRADCARLAGVSRQAVSAWLTKPQTQVGTRSQNLFRLAEGLGVSIEKLFQPLPLLENPKERKNTETEFLWDRLYPDLESFMAAITRGRADALARIVQVVGLYAGEKIAGKQIWKKFPHYKKYLSAPRRAQSELVWTYHESLR